MGFTTILVPIWDSDRAELAPREPGCEEFTGSRFGLPIRHITSLDLDGFFFEGIRLTRIHPRLALKNVPLRAVIYIKEGGPVTAGEGLYEDDGGDGYTLSAQVETYVSESGARSQNITAMMFAPPRYQIVDGFEELSIWFETIRAGDRGAKYRVDSYDTYW